jgi:hypothetical protein
MTSKCQNCGKSFDTVNEMRIHSAECKKKDPFRLNDNTKQLQNSSKNFKKNLI